MRIKVIKNKWEASIGFAIICHPYPDGWQNWDWDILIGNRNYTIVVVEKELG
jgi:hypothetical protein